MVVLNISNGEFCKHGQMICDGCGEKIGSEDYLIEEHYISKRGNEDDFNLTFHRKCSEDKNNECKQKWVDDDVEREGYIQAQIKRVNYKKAKKLLKLNYKYVELILNDNIK